MAPQCWQIFITVPFCAADVSPNGSRESRVFYQPRPIEEIIRLLCHELCTPRQPAALTCNLEVTERPEIVLCQRHGTL
jgi:hypothetical protein